MWWDVASGSERARLQPAVAVKDVAVQGARALLASGTGGELLRWNLEQTAWRQRLCGQVSRDLTPDERKRYLPGRDPRPVCGP